VTPGPDLRIPHILEMRVLAHARAAAPEECCGLLLGQDAEVREIYPARNAHATPRTRYLIDPADHFAAMRRARAAGLEVIGAYHSHPASAAEPSDTDTAEAIPGFYYLIVSPTTAQAAAFILAPRSLVRVTLRQ
jgi:proteasome lid subunit RPN8/RPN11